MASKAPPTAPTLPDGIEIFRAGTRTDDAGRVHVITASDVAACAAAYDPAVHEAPLTVGHPADNLPAYGWVKSLAVTEPGLLTSNHHQVDPQFAEMVAAGRFKKRSASFYHPADPSNPKPGIWYLRHVANLGAQPPAVKGLRDVSFACGQQFISFSETTNPNHQEHPMDKDLQAQLDAANQRAADEKAAREDAENEAKAARGELAQFAETAKAQRHAGHVSFAEGEIKAGRLLPKDKGSAVAVLDLLATVEPVSFSEGDTTQKVNPVEWVKTMISSAKPAVSFGEFAPGHAAGQSGAGSAQGKTDAEIDQAAKGYMRQHKVDYSEALSAVTSFTA